MIRKFFDWLEDWVMNDDNSFIGVGKLLLILLVVVLLLIGPFIYLASIQPSFTLQKAEWSCTQSHEDIQYVPMGKTLVPQMVSVCDEYHRIR